MTDLTIGQQVRWCARKRGIKLADLARSCGVSHSYLDTMLRNERLRLRRVEQIAGVLGVTPSSLLRPPGTPATPATPGRAPARETIYSKVRALMALRAWTLTQLARRLGQSRQGLQRALSRGTVNLGHLRALGDALGVSPGALLDPITQEDVLAVGRANL